MIGKNKIFLFLDDTPEERNAVEYKDSLIEAASNYLFLYLSFDKVDIVTNYNEFVNYIEKNGLPSFISFDHDLSKERYEEWIAAKIERREFEYSNLKEKTGLDCAKFLVQYCEKNNLSIPDYYVHSHNDNGKKNIISYLESYKKSKCT